MQNADAFCCKITIFVIPESEANAFDLINVTLADEDAFSKLSILLVLREELTIAQ